MLLKQSSLTHHWGGVQLLSLMTTAWVAAVTAMALIVVGFVVGTTGRVLVVHCIVVLVVTLVVVPVVVLVVVFVVVLVVVAAIVRHLV